MNTNLKKGLLYSASFVAIFALLAALHGCENYQFGDVSRQYCQSTNPETREQLRALVQSYIDSTGEPITLHDYCAMVGVPLAVLETVQ